MTREDLEARGDWQATFRARRSTRHLCLMRTMKGGFYWHDPNYDGAFAWGATSTFFPWHLDDFDLIAGNAPTTGQAVQP